jgi:hypothetical protein
VDVRRTTAVAVGLATLLTAYVLFVRLVRGSEPFVEAGTSLYRIIASYWIGGIVAGVLVGVALPIGRSAWGAALLGGIAGIPVTYAGLLALTTPEEWNTFVPVTSVVVGGLCGGPFAGLWIWVRRRQRVGANRSQR